MPRGVKKTQEAEVTSENNVTVEPTEPITEVDSKQPEQKSTAVTVESTDDQLKGGDDEKKSKPATEVSNKSKKTTQVKSDNKIEDRFYYIMRSVPLYLAKNTASPLIGMVSGKCRIRSQEGPWVKITIGVPEKGATTGYIMRNQAIIR